ncbi:hemin-degrading factor [Nisaea acidiphila]|uniref:Hemin-degrading factor n=1 Tax=Nisaea acidiphila TaxID=1862145 RepID=A0A9J7AP88_9PROT|nr:ChuX/HutX family heme-like substrate-binding protein [Nisaea acidiphila]UUX49015.1 hemin-degrading factor [Nisaea acidiphila]
MRTKPAENLLKELNRMKEEQGGIRARTAAEALGVPEAALLEARELEGSVRRLSVSGMDVVPLIERMPEAGDVMVLTRNEYCVHEKTGIFENMRFNTHMGSAFGREIDLRMFFTRWVTGFHVVDESPKMTRHSLQFFDASGTAAFKIYAVSGTDLDAFLALVGDFVDPDPQPLSFTDLEPAASEKPDSEVDVDDLRGRWSRLGNGHQFNRMLAELGLSRRQALRLAGEHYARPVPVSSVEYMLNSVAESGLPIMCFVRGPGCVQVHSGPVKTIKRAAGWLNILDPRFNLHLKDDQIDSCYAVCKVSTEKGLDITSLDCLAADGSTICQFFPVRGEGEEEPEAWLNLINGFVTGEAA